VSISVDIPVVEQVNPYRNVFMTFSISTFGPELLPP
jgi:hypothetical protein